MPIAEVTPKLSSTPEITNVANFTRVVATSNFTFDSFMGIRHFSKHLVFGSAWTGDTLEVFTAPNYEESDPLSKITVAANKVTFTGLERDEDGYVVKDFGGGYFDTFTHNCDVRITASVNYATQGLWAVSNTKNELNEILVADGQVIYIRHYMTGGEQRLYFGYKDGADNSDSSYRAISNGTTYYLTIERSGASAECHIYSDSGRTTLLETLSVTLSESTRTYQYVYGFAGYSTASGNYASSGYLENLTLSGGVGDNIVMKANDTSNDNAEDTTSSATTQGGFACLLSSAFLFSMHYHFATPNDFVVNVSYVNEIAKIVSLDEADMRLIFTFSGTPSVSGTKYTLGTFTLNVVAGTPSLSDSVLTVSPNGSDEICVTVSAADYTETFDGEAYGFNTLVDGKFMPAVTALTASDSHIVVKCRWKHGDQTTYSNDYVVLQNNGETPTGGTFYLTAWQWHNAKTTLLVGAEGETNPPVCMWNAVAYGWVKTSKTLQTNSLNFNQALWDRTQDYTMDSEAVTQAICAVPLTTSLYWYADEIFIVIHGESYLSDNSTVSDVYSHCHGSRVERPVERTLCRQRKKQLVVYQDNGATCSWTVCGNRQAYNFDDPARKNFEGTWSDEAIGPVWTRTTGDYRGLGVNDDDDTHAESIAFLNYKSNLSFNFEKCERTYIEFNIEPILPDTLNVDDYVHHTHLMVAGTTAEYGATLEATLETIGAPTTHAYDHGALDLTTVLAGTHYATPLRYILCYDSGDSLWHIVDLESAPTEGYAGWGGVVVEEGSIIQIRTIPGRNTNAKSSFMGTRPRRVSVMYTIKGTTAKSTLDTWKTRAINASDYALTYTEFGRTWIRGNFRVDAIRDIEKIPGTADSAGAEYLRFTVDLVEVIA